LTPVRQNRSQVTHAASAHRPDTPLKVEN
jgi:hypothetical protein